MIRLLIAAPSAVVRAGLESLLASSPAIELAGSFPDLASVDDLRPDVVLAAVPLDEISPPSNGYAPAIVLLSTGSAARWSAELVRLGIRAILPPDSSPDAILAAVESAAAGLAVIDPEELAAQLAISNPAPPPGEIDPLTPRELEVLRMMADGAANKNIAFTLGISEHTVKFHVASILAKLNAGTRTEAVTLGLRRGLILL